MLETRFTRLIGCRVPIQQAAIGGFATPRMAAAVSNAGGLGMVTGWGPTMTPEREAERVAATRALSWPCQKKRGGIPGLRDASKTKEGSSPTTRPPTLARELETRRPGGTDEAAAMRAIRAAIDSPSR